MILGSNSDLHGSDHYPIYVGFNVTLKSYELFHGSKRLHTSSTDWDIFRKEIVTQLFSHCFSINSFDLFSCYQTFVELVRNVLFTASTSSKYLDKKNNSKTYIARLLPLNPWWDAECAKPIGLRKGLLLKFKHSKSLDFINFKKTETKCRIELKRKKKSFRRFCEGLRKDSNLNYISGRPLKDLKAELI